MTDVIHLPDETVDETLAAKAAALSTLNKRLSEHAATLRGSKPATPSTQEVQQNPQG